MRPAFIYILAVLGANLTATLFLPFPGFGQVAVGTFIFGLTFTQRDRMHFQGRAFVYKVIFVAAILNLFFMLSFKFFWGPTLVAWLQKEGGMWLEQGMADLVASSARVFIASFTAIVLSEAADTEVYHKLRNRHWMIRVVHSNAVSIPLDSIIFNLIAFAGFFSWSLLASITFGEIVVKFCVGLLYAFWYPPRAAVTAIAG